MNAGNIANPTPALADLFEIGSDGVNLVGARCGSCGTVFFPGYHEQHRPGCDRAKTVRMLLDREGVLTSYTTQHYQAPPPFRTAANIAPYVIGLVEFNGEIQIPGIVVGCADDGLRIGMSMETTLFELYGAEDGRGVVTWAFRPVEKQS